MCKRVFFSFVLLLVYFDLLNAQSSSSVANKQYLPPRVLIVDYAMAYPKENAGLVRIFKEAGFNVNLRSYYPAMVGKDVSTYDIIILLGGGDPGMSTQEIDLAINYVSRGKTLILGTPSNGFYGKKRKTNPGVHDRYQFNNLLNRLKINLFVVNADNKLSKNLNSVAKFNPVINDSVGNNLGDEISFRPGTRVLVGSGAKPLLVESKLIKANKANQQESEKEPKYRFIRRNLRILPSNAIPGENINLLLRGRQKFRTNLYFRRRERSKPVDWETSKFKGVVESISEALDTLKIRMPGNRWGAEYARLNVPTKVIADAFVSREIREVIQSEDSLKSIWVDEETYGRMAIAAVGRTGRLNKGFVLVVDRDILAGIDLPLPPLGMPEAETEILEQFLGILAQYTRSLIENPTNWSSDHDYPVAQLPGNPKSNIAINNISVLADLPGRAQKVPFVSPSISASGMKIDNIPIQSYNSPLRGVWDFVTRQHDHITTLANILPELKMDFLWTVAPVESYLGEIPIAGGVRFKSWAVPISDLLSSTSTDWYVGLTAFSAIEGDYEQALDVRGKPTGLPSRFDMGYLNRSLFEPSRIIARHSLSYNNLKGIIHDWEPHINRLFRSYGMMDIFDDLHFQYFTRHLVQTGFYQGEELKSFIQLGRDKRFEWLLKSGYLATYFSILETNAERLGILYRKTVDVINPGLIHGAFVQSLKLDWYSLGFWKGVGTPDRPFLIFSYQRPPIWLRQFLRERNISARILPVGLLGLLNENDIANLHIATSDLGGYALERGIWLVEDPPKDVELNALPKSVPRDALLDVIQRSNEYSE